MQKLVAMPNLIAKASAASTLARALLFACGALSSALAQPAAAPPGWVVKTDRGGMAHGAGDVVKFETMKPGYHVTTGPAAILYDSSMRASGDWRLEATIHLFDPGARAEGFGVFFGGSNLSAATARYGYALVRRDGKAMLKARDGATTRTVRDWSSHAAIPLWRAGAGESVKYPLVVEARGDRVTMWIGPTQVLDAPRSELPTDGVVGLRVNHSLNVHIERIGVSPIARR